MTVLAEIVETVEDLIRQNPKKRWSIMEIRRHQQRRGGTPVHRTTITRNLERPMCERLRPHVELADPVYMSEDGRTWNGRGTRPSWCATPEQQAECEDRLRRHLADDREHVSDFIRVETADDLRLNPPNAEFNRSPVLILDELVAATKEMASNLDTAGIEDRAVIRKYGERLLEIGFELVEAVNARDSKVQEAMAALTELTNKFSVDVLRDALKHYDRA